MERHIKPFFAVWAGIVGLIALAVILPNTVGLLVQIFTIQLACWVWWQTRPFPFLRPRKQRFDR